MCALTSSFRVLQLRDGVGVLRVGARFGVLHLVGDLLDSSHPVLGGGSLKMRFLIIFPSQTLECNKQCKYWGVKLNARDHCES